MSGQRHSHRVLADEAAEWVITLAEDSTGNQERFVQWLNRSARHVEEFLLASSIFREFDQRLPRREGRIDHLVALARTHTGANVVRIAVEPARSDCDLPSAAATAAAPLPAARATGNGVRPTGYRYFRQPTHRYAFAAAAALVTLVMAGVWQLTNPSRWHSYTAGADEQRALALADGSQVHLNAGSRLQVRLGASARELRLLEGEAFFQVAADPARPFRVHAGQTLIQAVGTAFNVSRGEQETTVSVMEGAVRIVPAEGPPTNPPRAIGADFAADAGDAHAGTAAADILGPGEEARIGLAGDVVRRTGLDIAAMSAWRRDWLVFVDEPLADIVAGFNRHRHLPQIRIADQRAARLRLSGVFDASDPESMLLFVGRLDGLAVRHSGGQIIIFSPNPDDP